MDWKRLLVALLFFIIAGWFYQQHEHVLHNYEGSTWQRIDSKLSKPWFKNNSNPEIENHWFWQFFPFVRDGYHFFSWMMKLFYWLMFAIYLYKDEPYLRFIVYVGVTMALFDYVSSLITYGWTFK